jgi:hypothetical protein
VVRPCGWAWAGRGVGGQGPTGPWLLHQAAGGHSAPWRRHLVRAGAPPPPLLALPPLALYTGRHLRPGLRSASCPYALAPPPHPPPPLQLACRFPEGVCRSAQDITRERRRQAEGGAQLPSPMALSCTHSSASSRVGRAPPVVASVHHSSTALVRWALGAVYRGQCLYTCMVVSGMPAHAAQCSRPSGTTLPSALARPPFVRACACQRAIAGGVASSPCRHHAPVLLAVHRRCWRSAACRIPRRASWSGGQVGVERSTRSSTAALQWPECCHFAKWPITSTFDATVGALPALNRAVGSQKVVTSGNAALNGLTMLCV